MAIENETSVKPGSAVPPPKKKGEEKRILRDFIYLSGERYLAIVVQTVRGLIVPKILEPTQFGIWRSLQIIATFARMGHLGTVSALRREVPYYTGLQRSDKVNEVKNVAFTTHFCATVLLGIGLFVYTFWIEDPLIRMALRLFIFYILFEEVRLFLDTYLTGKKEFVFLAKVNFLHVVLGAVFAITGAVLYELKGLIVASIASIAAIVFLKLRKIAFSIRIKWNFPTFRHLLKIGSPLLVTGLLNDLLYNVDRMMIIKFLGMTHMGYYGLAITFTTIANQIAGTFARVLSPRLVERYSQTHEISSLRGFVLQPMLIISCITPFLLGGLYYFGEIVLQTFLSAYLPGLPAFKILLLHVFFFSLSFGLTTFFVTIHKQYRIIPFSIGAILLSTVLNYTAIRTGRGLTGVATATVITFICYSFALVSYAVSFYFAKPREYFVHFISILFPCVTGIALVLLLDMLGTHVWGAGFSLYNSFFKIGLFIICYSPFLIYVYRKWLVKRIFQPPQPGEDNNDYPGSE